MAITTNDWVGKKVKLTKPELDDSGCYHLSYPVIRLMYKKRAWKIYGFLISLASLNVKINNFTLT